ncbi:DgyrCDS100 [Dimorphilus gyrociliatus]|uniref:DgyrCDS100 n=1 Tax=Dimorphilus gyrociliatus TaxID=2664684 RepID=A0A7I8V3U0_9ANNE|nr:DgyrCDS100 [Dimorphilus gyrociliatus]
MKNFTSCFKDAKFLKFFFERLKPNDTGRFEQEFPFISPCGRERNYIRCDDCPIVFTHVIKGENSDLLSYGSTLHDSLSINFEPEKVCMLPSTGRIYHPAPKNGGGVGLLRSALAIEWRDYKEFVIPEEVVKGEQLDVDIPMRGIRNTLHLTKSKNIHANPVVTFLDDYKLKIPQNKDIFFYRDVSTSSSISMKLKKYGSLTAREFKGSFVYKNERYNMRPIQPSDTPPQNLTSLLERLNSGKIVRRRRRKRSAILAVMHVISKPIHLPRTPGSSVPNPFIPDSVSTSDLTGHIIGEYSFSYRSKSSGTEKPATYPDYNIELMLLLDHTVWDAAVQFADRDEQRAVANLKYDYAHIVNTVDTVYNSISPNNDSFAISVWLAEIRIARRLTDLRDTVYSDDSFIKFDFIDRKTQVNAQKVLRGLQYYRRDNGLTHAYPDHLQFITRYDLVGAKDGTFKPSLIGIAINRGVCTSFLSNSAVEELGVYTWFVSAHEMGHSLGAFHDGLDNSCSSNDKYLMTPLVGERLEVSQLANAFSLSSCSKEEIHRLATGTTDGYPRTCLYNRPCQHGQEIPDINGKPPLGIKYDLNLQCRITVDVDSRFCESGQGDKNICHVLRCYKDNLKSCVPYSPGAFPGTTCGLNHWCSGGKCVERTVSTPKPKDCVRVEVPTNLPDGCEDDPTFKKSVEIEKGHILGPFELPFKTEESTTQSETTTVSPSLSPFSTTVDVTTAKKTTSKVGTTTKIETTTKETESTTIESTTKEITSTDQKSTTAQTSSITTTETKIASTMTFPSTTESKRTTEKTTQNEITKTTQGQSTATTKKSTTTKLDLTSKKEMTTLIMTTQGATKLTDNPNCKDNRNDCIYYARGGYCQLRPNVMKLECPKTCNLCDSTPRTTPSTTCVDFREDCRYFENRGYCQTHVDIMATTCPSTCNLCDTGPDACRNDPCKNGGDCIRSGDGFSCVCKQGYKGYLCEEVDVCHINPCLNGGTCEQIGNIFNCICLPSFTGINCLTNICLDTCVNGQCTEVSEGTYDCECLSGYTGPTCSEKVQDSCNPNPCKIGAKCLNKGEDFECVCPHGYTGKICNETVDPCLLFEGCKNSGVCKKIDDQTVTCICPAGYTGPYCELGNGTGVCSPNPCANNGDCQFDSVSKSYKCTCKSGFEGEKCENRNLCFYFNPCKNDALCLPVTQSSIRCVCQAGYAGSICDLMLNPCSGTSCMNGGTCQALNGTSYSCQCPKGYTGSRCEVSPLTETATKSITQSITSPTTESNSTTQVVLNTKISTQDVTTRETTAQKVTTQEITTPEVTTDNKVQTKQEDTTFFELTTLKPTNNFDITSTPSITSPKTVISNCKDVRRDCDWFKGAGFCTPPNFREFMKRLCSKTCLLCEELNPCSINPCINDGQCQVDGSDFNCTCTENYYGDRCELIKACRTNPCLNGGYCGLDENNKVKCNCKKGYSGKNCENYACSSNPCHHSGSCSVDDNGNAICSCNSDYIGALCEIGPCPKCRNGGLCVVNEQKQASCSCRYPFTGKLCQLDLSACFNSPCGPNGICELIPEGSFRCSCKNFWTGPRCETRLDVVTSSCMDLYPEETCIFYRDTPGYHLCNFDDPRIKNRPDIIKTMKDNCAKTCDLC